MHAVFHGQQNAHVLNHPSPQLSSTIDQSRKHHSGVIWRETRDGKSCWDFRATFQASSGRFPLREDRRGVLKNRVYYTHNQHAGVAVNSCQTQDKITRDTKQPAGQVWTCDTSGGSAPDSSFSPDGSAVDLMLLSLPIHFQNPSARLPCVCV